MLRVLAGCILGSSLGTALYFWQTGNTFEADDVRIQWRYARRAESVGPPVRAGRGQGGLRSQEAALFTAAAAESRLGGARGGAGMCIQAYAHSLPPTCRPRRATRAAGGATRPPAAHAQRGGLPCFL